MPELIDILESHAEYIATDGESGARAVFAGMDLRGVTFSGMALAGADFREANLERAAFVKSDLDGALFTGSNVTGAAFRWASLRRAEFDYANASSADFRHAKLRHARFTHANLSRSEMSDADVRGLNLWAASLSHAVLPKQVRVIYGEKYDIVINGRRYVQVGCQLKTARQWFATESAPPGDLDFARRLADIIDFYIPGHGLTRPDWLL